MPELTETCRLCGSKKVSHFALANRRNYLCCEVCSLVFVVKSDLPTLAAEQAEYNLHNNDPGDQRYRAHLAKLTKPLTADLPTTVRGLDFGCGPGPTISVMLGEKGFSVADYDPVFFPDRTPLQKEYDFVSCTEVVEHFRNPQEDFRLLASLLKSGGRLGIMTQLLNNGIDFPSWYYPREISHVAFFSVETMDWIGKEFGWQLRVLQPNVVIFDD